MGIESLPHFLYQYTSLDNLEKILESRTLRFSRLDKVNDPEEAAASDLPFAASSVFVSCWSSDETESIPMWSMYGRDFQGVRFRLPANMFLGRQTPMVLEKGGAITIVDTEWTISRAEPAMRTTGRSIIGPNKIYYSDDPTFRNKQIVRRLDGRADFYPYDLGMVKGTYWAYEEEWRFKIAALPFEMQFPDDRFFNDVTLDLSKYPVLDDYLSVPLDPSALDELEVTIGSKADDKVVQAVESVLSVNAPSATIVRSNVPIR